LSNTQGLVMGQGSGSSVRARIGMVNFINTAPIHEIWKERQHDPSWLMVEEHPAMLNEMLARGDIDLGFVSSHEYGMRPERYEILEDLSISAQGSVGSVFLFSRVKPEMLSGLRVLLSAQSRTSICLVKIILEKFFKVAPDYLVAEVREARKKDVDAVLAIGDDALRLDLEGSYQYRLDLGEVWRIHTNLPFVFAVCAVRRQFCDEHPKLVRAIHQELIHCRDEGIKRLREICSLAAPKIPMAEDTCFTYLSGIEYNLDPAKQEALERFFGYLLDFNEARKEALPLKIRKIDE